MKVSRLPRTDAGKRTLELQQKIQQSGDDQERIVYVGRPVVVTPGELIFDPFLNGDDKMYWCALRLLSDGQSLLPDQGEMAERLGKTRQTIMTYQKMLRATRWLTVIHTVRCNNLPTRYSYSIHDEPLPVEEVTRIDANYIEFILSEATRTRAVVERLLTCCKQVLASHYRLFSEQMNNQQKMISLGVTGSGSPMPLPTQSGGDATIKNEPPLSKILDNGSTPFAVKNPDDSEAPLSKNLNNGAKSAVRNPSSAKVSLSKNLNNSVNPAVKDSGNGEIPLSKNPDSEENAVVKNPDTPEKTGSTTRDIYNRARVHPRAHIRARAPAQSRIKTYGFNNPPSIQGGGCGGRDGEEPSSRFAFLGEPPLSKLLPLLDSKYGKKTAHSIITRLKALHYTHHDTTFDYQVDAEDAAIILTSLLLDEKIALPLKYVDALIYRASQNELTFRNGQHQQFLQLTGQIEPDPQEQQRQEAQAQQAALDAIQLPSGTLLLGKSGTQYCIKGQMIRRCDGQPGGNTEDGLHAFRVQSVDDIKPLLLAGMLAIVGKMEEQA